MSGKAGCAWASAVAAGLAVLAGVLWVQGAAEVGHDEPAATPQMRDAGALPEGPWVEGRAETVAAPGTALAASGRGADEVLAGTDLAAKRRHQQALETRRERWMETLRGLAAGQAGTSIRASGDPALVQALEDALAAGRWNDVVAFADELGGHAHAALLLAALSTHGTLEAIVALLGRAGAPLPADSALRLALGSHADAAELARGLESYGLDAHHVDAFGRNAFHILAQGDLDEENTWRFAEFLASRNVTPKPRPLGLDPLDVVLTRILKHPRSSASAIRFARFLLDQGAPVEPSHLQLAALIASADERVYRRLTRLAPELAS